VWDNACREVLLLTWIHVASDEVWNSRIGIS
jgi:hypothetical protein